MQITDSHKRHLLTVYLPDTRGVTVSRFGVGNLKIGLGVHTYSRLPGHPRNAALGWYPGPSEPPAGTCPGATEECQAICYAARPVTEHGPVAEMWERNSMTEVVPKELPPDCRLVRLHVSGDFTSSTYIDGWRQLFEANPHVTVWAYTRSWRVPALLPALERLRALPNVQLFASMDQSTPELPPAGWRRAWIDGDTRAGTPLNETAHRDSSRERKQNFATFDGTMTYVCPEETKRKANCETCGYCFNGQRNDVTFLRH